MCLEHYRPVVGKEVVVVHLDSVGLSMPYVEVYYSEEAEEIGSF